MRLSAIIVLVLCAILIDTSVEGQTTFDALVGRYFRGDGLGEAFSLDIRRDGGFLYTNDTDVGNLDRAEGKIEIVDERVWFVPNAHAKLEPNSRLAGWWVFIQWGARRYLVEEAEMMKFVNAVNLAWEPRKTITGGYLLRRDDWSRPATGLPEIPAEWRKYLLRTPISATVTSVTGGAGEINVGRRKGILPGVRLMASAKDGGWFDVTVISVTPDSARVKVESSTESLFVGQRVTSRTPD